MAFIEVRFPTDIAYGSVGGPQYFTDIVITQSGYEQRNANWSQARAQYNVAHGVKTQAQLDTLIAFFRARKGRADGFRTAETRIIKKPVSGTINIYLGGVLQNISTYALDTTTGLVTFNTAPGNGIAITADFQFDVPVRFDTDRLAATIDSYGSRSWHDIPIVEIRV